MHTFECSNHIKCLSRFPETIIHHYFCPIFQIVTTVSSKSSKLNEEMTVIIINPYRKYLIITRLPWCGERHNNSCFLPLQAKMLQYRVFPPQGATCPTLIQQDLKRLDSTSAHTTLTLCCFWSRWRQDKTCLSPQFQFQTNILGGKICL